MSTVADLVRSIVNKPAFRSLQETWWRARGVGYVPRDLKQAREVFSYIYDRGLWREDRDVPLSGAGSTLEATRAIRDGLPGLLAQIGAASLVDVGCGDGTWMRETSLGVPYVGVDVVPSVIAANAAANRDPSRRFECLDAIRDPLPAADVALCREVLFHLSFADGRAVLRNIAACGARFLVATTDPSVTRNVDIATGGFRKIDLEKAPYGLPAPRAVLGDDALSRGRRLGVWAVEDLRAALDRGRP
jgi:SAM-dependent methyltransferase